MYCLFLLKAFYSVVAIEKQSLYQKFILFVKDENSIVHFQVFITTCHSGNPVGEMGGTVE